MQTYTRSGCVQRIRPSLLCQALRKAPDGLPDISEDTIRTVLLEAGFSWQNTRSWCEAGQAVRKRRRGKVIVTDPDADTQKNLIEQAHQIGEKMGLSVWNQDEAGPYQTKPYPDQLAAGRKPERQPHEYLRNGTVKLLTLFHPATGEVRVKGVTSSANAILHPWLKEELSHILQVLPPPKSVGYEKPIENFGNFGRKAYLWESPCRTTFQLCTE